MLQRVFVDANVLVSKTTRDWLFLLRSVTEGMFQLHCTEDVFAEVFRAIRKANPRMDGGAMTALRNRLNTSIDELVEQFDGQASFPGRDEGDIHVHAAALAAKSHIVLTADTGFLDVDPDELPYEVYTPDEFFQLIQAGSPGAVRDVARIQALHFAGIPGSKTLAQALRDAGCPAFADVVESHVRILADA